KNVVTLRFSGVWSHSGVASPALRRLSGERVRCWVQNGCFLAPTRPKFNDYSALSQPDLLWAAVNASRAYQDVGVSTPNRERSQRPRPSERGSARAPKCRDSYGRPPSAPP